MNLTSSMDSDDLSQLAAEHGADAWGSKSTGRSELLDVVRRLSSTIVHCSPSAHGA